MLLNVVVAKVAGTKRTFFVKPIAKGSGDNVNRRFIHPQLKLHFDYLEGELAKNHWFVADEFSAADIQISFPVEAAAQRAGLDARRPKLMAYLQRIHARPAYRQALGRGGPDSFAND